MIKSILIHNFKLFDDFELEFNNALNIIVGNNETGKSTVLEAINLVLTKRINGRLLDYELSPFLFNKDISSEYISKLKNGDNPDLPSITIEAYLNEADNLAAFRGSNNSKKEDAVGIKLNIDFDEACREEYAKLVEKPEQVTSIPAEYYQIRWTSFADKPINPRDRSIGVSFIDTSTIRLQNGTDYYLQNIINSNLEPEERASLNVAYRSLKEQFAELPPIKAINDNLIDTKGGISSKKLAISIDTSHRSGWESGLIPHLDDLPFNLVGQGEQSVLKTMLALDRHIEKTNVVLIEEPENHLSYSLMNRLIKEISQRCDGKQIVITTHSTFVLNKLGIDSLILFSENNQSAKISQLPEDTQEYFKKLSGYDTLRLILANKSILVEGPSDELIVQKAYKNLHADKLPIQDGIDVISVRGLSFSRFLDIAIQLEKKVTVVTDNDGDYKNNVEDKYSSYATHKNVCIAASNDNSRRSLESHIVEDNTLDSLNTVLDKSYTTKSEMLNYMKNNKTDWALRVFESTTQIILPSYITNVVS